MSVWDFLRELPVIDDLVDAGEVLGICLGASDSGEVPSEVLEQSPENKTADMSSVILPDYGEFRDGMYWTEVGDTGQDTREWLLEQSSSVPVEKDSSGQVVSGLWTDPHTGFTSSDPDDFDIDHRMPFHEVMSCYPEIYNLPSDEQLAIYNDLNNLQVIHDDHNMDKGARPGHVHAKEISDEEFQKQFLADYHAYRGSLESRFSH